MGRLGHVGGGGLGRRGGTLWNERPLWEKGVVVAAQTSMETGPPEYGVEK